MLTSNVTRICVERILPHHVDHHNTIKHDDRLRAAFWGAKTWKQNSVITIGFLDSPTPNQPRTSMEKMKEVGRNIDPLQLEISDETPLKEVVKRVVRERIEPLVNLTFEFLPDENAKAADIRITFADEDASWSLIGTDALHNKEKGEATMNLGWFDVGTYIHEFCHALGMVHEHQNPRSKSGIKWDNEKLYKYMSATQGWDKSQVDTNIIDRYDLDQINGSEFDPLSVMLYFFPDNLTTNNKGTKQNFSLSGLDALWISKTYPGSEISPENFYESVYKKSLKQSIKESENFDKPSIYSKLFFLASLMVITGVVIFLLIKLFAKINEKKSPYRINTY
tara:strand:+ start:312 stop:1319 length:1008 start_codon:yes stop_codon:yes gene_type:complete